MSDEADNREPSPFDHLEGSSIEATVVDASPPRIHGYSVDDDLAAHYSLTDVIYLSLTGELPASEAQSRAVELALIVSMPVDIANASIHAARLTRHLMSTNENPAAVAAVAGIGLSEQVRHLLQGCDDLIRWLGTGGNFPLQSKAESEAERTRVRRFSELLPESIAGELFRQDPGLAAAVVGVLHTCGLEQPRQMLGALVSVQLPVAIAEAYGVDDPSLWRYPLNLPHWIYTGHSDG